MMGGTTYDGPERRKVPTEHSIQVDCAHEVARLAADDISSRLPALVADIVRDEFHKELIALFGADQGDAKSMKEFRRQQIWLEEISSPRNQDIWHAVEKAYGFWGILSAGAIVAVATSLVASVVTLIRKF